MFDIREIELMFLDPTDYVINNLNKLLNNIKIIQIIFS